MQLRFKTGLTSEAYVSSEAWREATLDECPLHRGGGCSFRRHGTYERKAPPGARVARWYCPQGHETFSLLADCLAGRLPGTLAEAEAVVAAVEQAPSLEAAADALRPEVELPGAIRWTRRRVQRVHAALTSVCGLLPVRFAGCAPTLTDFRRHLETDRALERLRDIAAQHLHVLGSPVGFAPRRTGGGDPNHRVQHSTGADPPNRPR